MNLCLISPSILTTPPVYGGAIETFTYELGLQLAKSNNKVIIITGEGIDRKKRVRTNLIIYYLKIPKNPLIRGIIYNLKLFLILLKLRKINILHTQATSVIPGVLIISKILKVPIIHTEHVYRPWIKPLYNSVKRKMKFPIDLVLGKITVERSQKIVVANEIIKKSIQRMNSERKKRVEVISQGIDTNLFDCDKKVNNIQEKYNFSETDIIILYVGRINPEKNIEILIKAFLNLRKKHSNLKLLLVGPISDHFSAINRYETPSKYYKKLKKLIEGHDLLNAIIFAGSIPYNKIPFYYLCANFLVQPSPLETFGRAIFEAAAMGIPFICSQIGNFIPNYLPKTSGFFIKKINVENLTSAMSHLIENIQKYERNAVINAPFIHKRFNWEEISQKYLKIYRKILKKDEFK